ncbi:hypothetical protein [Streptomyces sp. NPDC060194]|uniref:hypothetical protein n=1 Tax=Streptomyces sp. NPDC060194 TaxID=3347069 RepID=UPI003664D80A
MASRSSGIVAGLTAAALAVVGFLGWQASANVPADLGKEQGGSSKESTAPKAPGKKTDPKALPADSGTGQRVVYSLGQDRVWLVTETGDVSRTFEVTPGTVDPALGTTPVSSRSKSTTGSDGARIEHVVRFGGGSETPIGFSAAVDGSTPAPDPDRETGGIRESRADGEAMWLFAGIGTDVVVVP